VTEDPPKKKLKEAYSPLMAKVKPDGKPRMTLSIDPEKGASSLTPDHSWDRSMNSKTKAMRTKKKKRAEERRLKREQRRKRDAKSKGKR